MTPLLGLVPSLAAAALALAPGERSAWIGPLRTLALVTAGIVVLVSLMPEALAELGALALGVFGLALVAPTAVERLWPSSEITLHAALAGLVLHQGIDGLQLGTLGQRYGMATVLAIGVHGAPLVLAAVLATKRHMGARSAGIASAALVGALLLGMGIGEGVPDAVVDRFEPWLVAVASGLLLHVLAHDLGSDLPQTAADRATDLLNAVAGGALTLWMLDGGRLRELHQDHDHIPFSTALLDLSVDAAPVLLAATAVGVITMRFARPDRGLSWLEDVDAVALRLSSWVAVGLVLLAYVVAYAHVDGVVPLELADLASHEHSPVGWIGAGGLLAVVLRSLAKTSLRERLVEMVGAHAHHHHHHDHGHSHEH